MKLFKRSFNIVSLCDQNGLDSANRSRHMFDYQWELMPIDVYSFKSIFHEQLILLIGITVWNEESLAQNTRMTKDWR